MTEFPVIKEISFESISCWREGAAQPPLHDTKRGMTTKTRMASTSKDDDFEEEIETESNDHATSDHTGDKRKRIFSKECK